MFIQIPSIVSHQAETYQFLLEHISMVNTALQEGFSSIKPEKIVANSITRYPDELVIMNQKFSIRNKNLYIIGAGKATFDIAQSLIPLLGSNYKAGIINIPSSQFETPPTLPHTTIYQTSHPIPDQETFSGTAQQLELLHTLHEEDIVFVIISGGASSLFEVHTDQLTDTDVITTYILLLTSGLPIHEINIVRKHLSQVKGGKLLTHTKAHIIGLLVSDVPGNDLSAIGSGPTVKDLSTFQDCKNILVKSALFESIPTSVRDFIVSGVTHEKEQAYQGLSSIPKIQNFLLSSNLTLLHTMRTILQSHGMPTEICSSAFNGEAKDIGEFLVNYLHYPYTGVPMCLLFGGESVVTINPANLKKDARGGRNQELILSSLFQYLDLPAFDNFLLVSIGSDGVDGMSDNAGAWFASETASHLPEIDATFIKKFLAEHNSSNCLPSDYYIHTGPTGTNVGDIIILLKY